MLSKDDLKSVANVICNSSMYESYKRSYLANVEESFWSRLPVHLGSPEYLEKV